MVEHLLLGGGVRDGCPRCRNLSGARATPVHRAPSCVLIMPLGSAVGQFGQLHSSQQAAFVAPSMQQPWDVTCFLLPLPRS